MYTERFFFFLLDINLSLRCNQNLQYNKLLPYDQLLQSSVIQSSHAGNDFIAGDYFF